MKVLKEGHRYHLANHEHPERDGQILQFIEKVPAIKYTGSIPEGALPRDLVLVSDGTTNEEVLEMMINRMEYLQYMFPCRENIMVLNKLDEALYFLKRRTEKRKEQGVEGKHLPHKS